MSYEIQKREDIKTLNEDSVFYFLYKKVERISLAIYLITDFFDTRESLKWELRNTTNKILTNVFELYEGRISKNDLHSEILKLESFLLLAYRGRMISDMNYEIIQDEIERLKKEVLVIISGHSRDKQVILNKNFFKIESENTETESVEIKKDTYIHKGQKNNKQNVLYKNTSIPNKKAIKTSSFNNKPIKTSREEKIMDMVKNKQPISIKDITHSFDGVSEKTIQRDLIGLIKKGLIKREGERRWSTYSIA